MKKFTVVGYYIDTSEPFVLRVQAEDPRHAARLAGLEVQVSGREEAAVIVEALPGHSAECEGIGTVAMAREFRYGCRPAAGVW